MPQKEKTVQLGLRVRKSVKDRLDAFVVNHPWQPSIVAVVEKAILELIDREEKQPPANRPRKQG